MCIERLGPPYLTRMMVCVRGCCWHRGKNKCAAEKIEALLKGGHVEQWKTAIKAFSVADQNRGNVHFIEPEVRRAAAV